MTTAHAWANLKRADSPDELTAQRVNADVDWDLYWARDFENKCLLVLSHKSDQQIGHRLPRLREIEIKNVRVPGDKSRFFLRLLDVEHRDLFYQFCCDLIQAATQAPSEAEAVNRIVNRSWRWHRLLKGKGSSTLTEREQRGLFAELLMLHDELIPHHGPAIAVEAWKGPLHAAQDFQLPDRAIEVKSVESRPPPSITVSSEYQLDEAEAGPLLLAAYEILETQDGHDVGMTLAELVQSVRDKITAAGAEACKTLNTLLEAAGYDDDPEYERISWKRQRLTVYSVNSSFPAIRHSTTSSHINSVNYRLELSGLEDHRVDHSALTNALENPEHD